MSHGDTFVGQVGVAPERVKYQASTNNLQEEQNEKRYYR